MKTYLSKYFYILGKRRRELVFLVLLFVILSFLDLIGIGLIGPFVAIVSTPEKLNTYKVWKLFKSFLWNDSNNTGLVALGIIIVAVFYVKGVGAYLAQKRIVRFGFIRQSDLMSSLMAAYQRIPYHYHIQRNSASLIQSIIYKTDVYTSQTLIASLRLVSDIIILLMIIILLANVDFLAMFSMILLLLVIGFIYDKFVKHRMLSAGKNMANAQREIIKSINQGIGGLKEIRLLGKEKYFQNKVEENAVIYADAGGMYRGLILLPRYLIESAMITFIVGFAAVVLLIRGETSHIIPTLAIFGIAAVRLMPSANTIVASINDLRYSKFAVDELYNDLREVDEGLKNIHVIDKEVSDDVSGKKKEEFNVITMNGISYKYPGIDNHAVEKVSVEIQRGKSIGLIGKSGSGKTTLVDVLLGFLTPQEGKIEIDGRPAGGNLRAWRNMFAYIPQDIHLIDDSIKHNIAFGIDDRDIDEKRLLDAVKEAQLKELIEQLPDGIETVVGERGVRLSGGQRQRVALARAFYYEREIIVMDEATAALDNETEQQIVSAIKNLKGRKTLIVIAHRMTTVEHCDVIYKLDSGKIAAKGSFEEVIG